MGSYIRAMGLATGSSAGAGASPSAMVFSRYRGRVWGAKTCNEEVFYYYDYDCETLGLPNKQAGQTRNCTVSCLLSQARCLLTVTTTATAAALVGGMPG